MVGFVAGGSALLSCAQDVTASAPIPGVTEFAFGRLLNPEEDVEQLSLTAEGHLMVRVRGEMMSRTDALLVCSENLETRPLNRRMQGRAVPEVFRRLVSLEGEGHMVLSREDERFYPLQLHRDLCFFVEHFLWALEATLMWDVGQLPGSRGVREMALVRAAGEGLLALRVPGELVAVKIAGDRPYRIHVAGFVGWVGNVVPRMERDVPYLHCEGEGAVFVSLPGSSTRSAGGASAGPSTGGGRAP